MKTLKQAFFLVFLELSSFLIWNISGRWGGGRDDCQRDGELVEGRFLCALSVTQLGKVLLLIAS